MLTCFALKTSAQAAFPGKNGKIAFIAHPATGVPTDIYSVNADGTGLVNLTNTRATRKATPPGPPTVPVSHSSPGNRRAHSSMTSI